MIRPIALGFVIFNPEDSFLPRVKKMLESGVDVYVFDNSPDKRIFKGFSGGVGRLHYLTCGKNRGLGLGISSICAHAYYDNYSAMVFFDQDSIFDGATMNFIEKFYVEHPELAVTHSAVVFKATKAAQDPRECCVKDVALAINSGSLFYLNNLKALNWHSDGYFVDGVDYEFCLRSSLHGFRIGEYSGAPGFDHSAEQPDEEYSIFGRVYSMREYSFRRIIDVSTSSIKLTFSALIGGKMDFSIRIMRLWVAYLVTQVMVRFMKPIDRCKYTK